MTIFYESSGRFLWWLLTHFPWFSLWEDILGHALVATFVGIVVGIPAALWVNRRIKAKETATEYKKERVRERDILLLIKEELEFSQQGLEVRGKNPSALMSQPFKTDLWESISASGMLGLIESPTLLNRVASAYYVLHIVQRIEAQCHVATRGATVTFSGGTTAARLLLTDAQGFYDLLKNSVNKAIEEVNNRISQLP